MHVQQRRLDTTAGKLMTMTDREIDEAVLSELEWDTRVDARAIEVQAERGRVNLRGKVGSWAERLAAQEAAHRVGGVREVINRIEVELTPEARRSDAQLARAVQSALDSDVLVPQAVVHSSASGGQVILEGQVDFCSQRDDAERVVRNIRGVRRVLNQILVRPTVGDAYEVQKSIEAALERRGERRAPRIDLDVHDGKVILAGVVHSWAERQSVIAAVKGTRGVRSVDDRLSIEP
ncbi:MAG: BON domain-containing protein [Pseudomonadota bacterium]